MLLCLAVYCGAREYFVSNDGNDKWPGTKQQPLKTINAAADRVQPGDVVTVRGGTYRERVLIKRSGTAAKPIIFRGAPGETALLTGAFPIEKPWKKTPGYRFIYESYSPYAVSMLFDSILLNRYLEVEDMNLLDRQPGAYLLDRRPANCTSTPFPDATPIPSV